MTDRDLVVGIVLAALCVVLPPSRASAQTDAGWMGDVHHTAWMAGQELPTSGVLGAIRSPDGYLWLGSAAGLVRFDGARFVVLDGRAEPALHSTGPGLTRPLLVDRTGTLWIGRADGALVRYRGGRFEVAVDASPVARDAAQSTPAPVLVEDRAGTLWFMAAGRVFTAHDGALVPARLPPELPEEEVIAIAAAPSGLWVGTRTRGLWHVAGTGATLVPRPHDPEIPRVLPLLHDRAGRLWVQGDGLRFFDGKTWTQPLVDGRDIGASNVAEAPDGSIWVAGNGLGVLRWRDGVLERFTTDGGLTHMAPSAIFADNEGSVWLTSDAGLDRLRPATFTTLDRRHGLPFDSPLLGVDDETGGIWVRDYAGDIFHLTGGPAGPAGPPLDVRRLSTRRDVPFASAVGGGVWLFELHSARVYRVRGGEISDVRPSPALAWRGPRHGFEDASGTLWLAARAGGLGRVRDLTYQPVSLPGYGDAPPVASLAADGRGGVWVSIHRTPELFRVHGDSVVGPFGASHGITEPLLNLVAETGDTLWASTESGTLVRLVGGRATAVVEPGIQAALAASAAVLVPDGTHLWIGSATGIGRVPLRALHAAADGRADPPSLQRFGPADGLQVGRTNRFSVGSGFRAHDGRIWFTTPAGLAVVNPRDIPVNRAPPTPGVEALRVVGRDGAVTGGGTVDANPERLEVSFTAGSLRMPERAEVEYRLDGADLDWVRAGEARTATYTRLRPGHYRFRVRARNEDGVPALAEATLGFRVLPAWYQARWFLGLVALTIAAAGAGTVGAWAHVTSRAETRRLRDRYEAALAERARVAQELHDTLLQGFLGVTLHLQAVQDTIERAPREAADALARVLALADHTLREGRQMMWDMHPPELEGQGLPQALEAAVRRTAGDLPIDLSVTLQGKPRTLPPDVETTVLRVGRESVSNAVRHAQPRRISVILMYEEGAVRLHVRDDGTGFDPERMAGVDGDGHRGIRGMHERARRAGGAVQVLSSPAGGTTVDLHLPAPPDAL